MRIIKTPQEWISEQQVLFGKRVGLVPTMGALHSGHLSLVERSIRENDVIVVSIFLNPVQFNNKSDLDTYPVSFHEDCALLEKAGVQYVFAPDYDVLYPDNYTYRMTETALSRTLCGASRPGHFDGVLTVVLKLLLLFQAQKAYFGEKDYQQLRLVEGMCRAFFVRTEIVPCPIVRAESGLALSSRNKRLSEEGLKKAPLFHAIIDSHKTVDVISRELENAGFKVDYVTEDCGRLYAAVFLEEVRLIDNVSR